MLGVLLITGISAPLWTFLMVSIFDFLFKPRAWFRRWAWRLWNDRWFDLYASWTALTRLNASLYLQGLFYYVIGFSFGLLAVVVFSAVSIIPGMVYALLLNVSISASAHSVLSDIVNVVVLAFSLAFAFFIVRPLAELLKACLNRPTAAAYAMDLQLIKQLLEKTKGRHLGVPSELSDRICDELRSVLSHYKRQERRVFRCSQNEFDAFLRERAAYCKSLSECYESLPPKQNDLSLALRHLLTGQLLADIELNRGVGLMTSRKDVDSFSGKQFETLGIQENAS
jgi:hypothetical protein